jgi:signal transduction histidine kinase
VKLAREPERVILTVRDFGNGIPAESLSKFEQNGRHMGVGLAGMRERVNDLEGQLEIRSGPDGTVVQVWVPLPVASSDVAA